MDLSTLFKRKNVGWYAGNVFDRFKGLDFLFQNCKQKTILDFGSNDGLIAYEFARNGIKLVHGFEYNVRKLNFSKHLFLNVPVESEFMFTDLSKSFKKTKNKFRHILLDRYDIVLYLGVYHHLIRQSNLELVENNLTEVLELTEKYIAVRTPRIKELESFISKHGFRIVTKEGYSDIGSLTVFERV